MYGNYYCSQRCTPRKRIWGLWSSGVGNCFLLRAQGWGIDYQERKKLQTPGDLPGRHGNRTNWKTSEYATSYWLDASPTRPLTNLANFARIVGSTCYSAMAPKLTPLMKDGIIFIIQLKFPSAMKSKKKLRIASRMERVMEILRHLYQAW